MWPQRALERSHRPRVYSSESHAVLKQFLERHVQQDQAAVSEGCTSPNFQMFPTFDIQSKFRVFTYWKLFFLHSGNGTKLMQTYCHFFQFIVNFHDHFFILFFNILKCEINLHSLDSNSYKKLYSRGFSTRPISPTPFLKFSNKRDVILLVSHLLFK